MLFGFIYYIISIVHKDFDYFYIYANGTDKGNLLRSLQFIKYKLELPMLEEKCLTGLINCTLAQVGDRGTPKCELEPVMNDASSCPMDEFNSIRQCYDSVDQYEADRAEDKCFTDITSFCTAVLFSYETQTTIGYGGRHPTERCPRFQILTTSFTFGKP